MCADPIRGVVTMDQTIVEVTGGPEVHPGDQVVLLGEQGDERITAQEWADRLDTIPYEVVCGFSVRLPRQRPAPQPRGDHRRRGDRAASPTARA